MSLKLAAEQQRGGGSTSLRDNLIGQALDEGHSAADIAEALGLSPQAVYRVRERLEREETARHGGRAADMRAVADALERFSDPSGFERLVSALIGDLDPAAIPLGGSGDRGRDAADPGSKTIFTISLKRDWKGKVRADLERIVSEGFRPERVFAVTNRRTARRSAEELASEAAKHGIELHVLDQHWLVAKLSQPPHLHLRSECLGLAPPRGRTFLTAQEYAALLDGRPHLAGMDAAFVGRERERGRAAELLDGEGVAMLRGVAGMGKTRLALQLAGETGGEWRFIDADMPFDSESFSELPPASRLTVVIDNAHRRERLAELVAGLEQLRVRPRVLLVARPGFEAQLDGELARTWVGPIGEARTVDVGPLRWEEMAQVLRSAPLKIESGPQRRELVRLAEGNPQIAVIAARVARERGSVLGLSADELLQRYIAYLVSSTIPAGPEESRGRKLLALLAALDGVDAGDAELLAELGGLLRVDPALVAGSLERLAESGLVVSERGRYRIKPDLLAEHVLFALTLSGRWMPALDYREIVERFGSTHLRRLAATLGALPADLIEADEGAVSRLGLFEAHVEQAVRSAPQREAAETLRDLSRARPRLAQRLGGALLERIRAGEEALSVRTVEALCAGAMRIADFPLSWRLLLRLAAECAGSPELRKQVGEAMDETYQRLPEGDAASGATLAWVQQSLAEETERFWSRRRQGAAGAVALAVRPMLKVNYETHRSSPDNPMTLEIGRRLLPESKDTHRVLGSGAKLATEIFPGLDASEQLQLLETAGWAAHAAAGFRMGPAPAPLAPRAMLDGALVGFDRMVVERLEKLEMPVRAAAYDYLLKRVRYRRKVRDELEEEGAPAASGQPLIEPPRPSAELREYLFLIHNREVGPVEPDRGGWREEHQRRMAAAGALAAELAADPEWRERLDRWTEWWEARRALERGPRLGPTPAMVFDALAKGDVERGADAIEHLVATGSGLRETTAVAMSRVVQSGLAVRWKPWLAADAETKATLAGALAGCGEEIAAAPMRQLAFDPEPSVRRAAQEALSFAVSSESWHLDLALDAVAADPQLDVIARILHMADQRSEEAGGGAAELDERHRDLLAQAILATASSPSLEGYQLADVLERASRERSGIALDWVWARLAQLDQMRESREKLRRWELDFLPDEMEPLVREQAGSADLQRAIDLFAELPDRSPALADAAKLIGWLGGGEDTVTELLASLLEGERASRANTFLLDLSLSPEQLDRRAEALAETLEDPGPILHALVEATLPTAWSGSYVPHLETALTHVEGWMTSPSAPLRQAGRELRTYYRRRLERERVSEEEEDRAFEYR